MPLVLDGTNGVGGVNGSASSPAFEGTDANTGIFFPAADTIAFAEGGTEVARFDSSGNFGIGTSSPSSKLQVKSAGSIIRLETTAARGSGSNYLQYIDPTGDKGYVGYISGSSDDFAIYNALSANTTFATGGTERMRIDSSGRVTMPYQPSFWVPTTGCTRNVTTGIVQGYPAPFFNVGSNFNVTTGYFTAPITGLYAFYASKYNAATNSGTMGLYVNNVQRSYNDFNGNAGGIGTHPNATLYYILNAGDTVGMYITSSFNANDANDYFGGYLVG